MELFKSLDLGNINSHNITILENKFTIDINSLNSFGYIMSFEEDNEKTIIVDIKQNSNQNNLESLIKKIKSSVDTLGNNLTYSTYVKAKISTDNISLTNKNIIKLLRFEGFTNIDTIDFNNGLSTVASRKGNGITLNTRKFADFNYAVATYSSGTYIILGAPVIPVSY